MFINACEESELHKAAFNAIKTFVAKHGTEAANKVYAAAVHQLVEEVQVQPRRIRRAEFILVSSALSGSEQPTRTPRFHISDVSAGIARAP
jgi:hypothetical protein